MTPTITRSEIEGCYIFGRGDETILQDNGDGTWMINLHKYLICPLEKLEDEQLVALGIEELKSEGKPR